MSIVPMQKVRVAVHKDDSDAFLQILQRHGAMEFIETTVSDYSKSTTPFPYQTLLARITASIIVLEPFATKQSLWQQLRQGSTNIVRESEIAVLQQNMNEAVAVVAEVENENEQLQQLHGSLRNALEAKAFYVSWQELPYALADLETSHTVTLLLRYDSQKDTVPTKISIEQAFAAAGVTAHAHEVRAQYFAVTCLKKEVQQSNLSNVLSELQLEHVVAPRSGGLPTVEIANVTKEISELQIKVSEKETQLAELASQYISMLRTHLELLQWQRDRFLSLEKGVATNRVVIVEGWLDLTTKSQIEAEVMNAGLAAALEEIVPEDGEEPPVEIRNNSLIQPFEAITRLYGMPGYRDIDPTAFLAGFFFLFFGLSLTDVGYGLILVVVSAASLVLFKLSKQIKLFLKLLLFVGIATTLVGMVFGGYLGIDPSYLPPALQAIQLFDPIANPLPVFYMALGLGVVQIMFGMLLKIYSESRNGRLLSGVLDHGPWFTMFTLGILYLAVTLEYVTAITVDAVMMLIYGTLLLIVVTSARHATGVLDMIKLSLLSLYNSLGYLSDILSYSRLLALGLATTALAFAVNLIADIVSGSVPYLGPVLAVAVLIIGHLFTLAVNTLGAFIHSARLQFVEFFGKFIAGTGRSFAPLARSEQHITIIDD